MIEASIFAPDDRKYCFNVMLFGPTKAPPFYTAMMKDFKDEWENLFLMQLMYLKTFKGILIALSAAGIVTIDDKAIVFGSNIIIDDILLWCDIKELIISYFCCF